MKPVHLLILRHLRDRGPLAPDKRHLVALFVELFDLGWVNVCPPGHRYKINVAGLAACAAWDEPATAQASAAA